MPKTLLHSLANPSKYIIQTLHDLFAIQCFTIADGTEYRLHVLSPFNSLLPAQAVFIFVTISLSLESQRVSLQYLRNYLYKEV